MIQLWRELSYILNRRTKKRLALAAAGSALIALLDSLAIGLVLPLVSSVAGTISVPGPLRFLVEPLGAGGPNSSLQLRLTAVVVTLFIVKDIGSLIFSWWTSGFLYAERARTSASILDRILRSPYALLSSRSTSDMLQVTDTAVVQVFNTTLYNLVFAATSVMTIVFILGALMLIAPLVTAILAAYFGLLALLFQRVAKPAAVRAGIIASEASLDGYRTSFAAFGGIKEIKLRGTFDRFVGPYRRAQLSGAHALRTSTFLSGMPRYLLEIFFIIAIGAVVVVTRGSAGSETVGLVALFVAAGFRLLPAVTMVLGNVNAIRFGAEYVSILHRELLNSADTHDSAESGNGERLPLNDKIVLDAVHFRYPNSPEDVLRGVSLAIQHGSSTAIVGSSGAGKTTLVDVILGLCCPQHGQVTVDGVNIHSATASWQQNLGYVAQDTFLLDGSLAENVVFELEPDQIDRERVETALQDAELGSLVAELEHGIDTDLGERGSRLSGGQRQRVGIARALYRDCRVLILDEATSALDNETEHRVTSAINRLKGRMTVIIVAHRLSTVRHADSIAFLEDGRVTGVGTFDDLLRTHVAFAHLVKLGSLEALP